eukprot:Platyproteum_vivax@DN3421_c0_g1_i1.p1
MILETANNLVKLFERTTRSDSDEALINTYIASVEAANQLQNHRGLEPRVFRMFPLRGGQNQSEIDKREPEDSLTVKLFMDEILRVLENRPRVRLIYSKKRLSGAGRVSSYKVKKQVLDMGGFSKNDTLREKVLNRWDLVTGMVNMNKKRDKYVKSAVRHIEKKDESKRSIRTDERVNGANLMKQAIIKNRMTGLAMHHC